MTNTEKAAELRRIAKELELFAQHFENGTQATECDAQLAQLADKLEYVALYADDAPSLRTHHARR